MDNLFLDNFYTVIFVILLYELYGYAPEFYCFCVIL